MKQAGVDNEGGRFNKLYDDAFDRKAKLEMERNQKKKNEEEEAIQLSQMPLAKKRMNGQNIGIRSHDKFMED